MAIDDPISAIQPLNANDERQQSPVLRMATQFLEIAKLLSPPGAEFPIGGIKAALDWLSRREEANRRGLVDVIAEEVKRHGGELRRLLATSAEHRRFMEEEMPGLVLDALRRAEQVRAKDRIRRLGRILVHAAEVGSRDGADQVEGLMRIAMELTDRDIIPLREIRHHPLPYLPPPSRLIRGKGIEAWDKIQWQKLGFSEHDVAFPRHVDGALAVWRSEPIRIAAHEGFHTAGARTLHGIPSMGFKIKSPSPHQITGCFIN